MRLDINHQPLNFDIYMEQVIEIPKTSIDEPPYDFSLELEALKRVDQIIDRTLNETKRAVINHSDQEQDDHHMSPGQSPLLRFTTSTTLAPDTTPATVTQLQEQCNSQSISSGTTHPDSNNFKIVPTTQAAMAPPPSCPMEVPLTPIKCFIEPMSTTDSTLSSTTMAQAPPTQTNMATNCNSKQESNSDRSTVNQINPRDFEEMHYNPFDHLELQTIDELKELDLVFQASYANRASKQ